MLYARKEHTMKDITLTQISAFEKILAKSQGRDRIPRVCFNERISTGKWECEYQGIRQATVDALVDHGLLREDVVIPSPMRSEAKFHNTYFKYELTISLEAAKCLIAGWAVGSRAKLALAG